MQEILSEPNARRGSRSALVSHNGAVLNAFALMRVTMSALVLGSILFEGFEQEQTALFILQVLAVLASVFTIGLSLVWLVRGLRGETRIEAGGGLILLDSLLAIGVMSVLDASSSPLAWVALIAPVLETAVFFSVSSAAFVWIGLGLSFLALRLTTNISDDTTGETLLLAIQQVLAVLFVSGPAALMVDAARDRIDNLSDSRSNAEATSNRLRRITDTARKMSQQEHLDEILAITCQGATAIGFDQADVVVTTEAGESSIHSMQSNGSGSRLPAEMLSELDGTPVRTTDIDDPANSAALQIAGFTHGIAMDLSDSESTERVSLRVWSRDESATPGQTQALELLVGHARESYRSAEVLQQAQEYSNQLLHEVHHDGLTGLANRTFVMERLFELLRTREPIAIFFIDLDGFKTINDTQGHNAGDTALKIVANRLLATGRDSEIAGRMGGDEFILITPVTSFDTVETLTAHGDQIVESVSKSIKFRGQDLRLGASVGIAVNDGKVGPDQLISLADDAMYEAKRQGGGTQVSQASLNLFEQRRAS